MKKNKKIEAIKKEKMKNILILHEELCLLLFTV